MIYPDPPGGVIPPVFMRHPQPSEVQRGLSSGGVYGGVYVIVTEGDEPIYLLYETNNAQNLVILFSGILLKLVATRCHILQLKCTKFDFGWGSAPDPAEELTALPQTPVAVGSHGHRCSCLTR